MDIIRAVLRKTFAIPYYTDIRLHECEIVDMITVPRQGLSSSDDYAQRVESIIRASLEQATQRLTRSDTDVTHQQPVAVKVDDLRLSDVFLVTFLCVTETKPTHTRVSDALLLTMSE